MDPHFVAVITVTPKPCVLVVDDSRANRVALRVLLEPIDAKIIEAASGAEALQACLDHEFALILLDVQMPIMDGFEVASILTAEPATREVPIIFVTAAYADDINRVRGYKYGAVDYIAKPVNDQVLLSKVRVFIELWNGKRELKRLLSVLNERNKKLEEEVAERKRIEAVVRHEAQHDPLTGLPNRILLLDRIDTCLERAARNKNAFAFLYIDLDGFKKINDNFGHAAGDLLLQQVSHRMVREVRKTDTVARISGDEFAVVLEEVSGAMQAMVVAQKIVHSLSTPYLLDLLDGPVQVRVSASIGIALYPDHGSVRDDLIQSADRAMYQAKRDGKNRVMLVLPNNESPMLTGYT